MNKDKTLKQLILRLLKEVIDPELLINIVDLGLVYNIEVNEQNKCIELIISLTSKGCPLGELIVENIYQILRQQLSEYETKVHLVWEPAWSPDFLTEEGRIALSRI